MVARVPISGPTSAAPVAGRCEDVVGIGRDAIDAAVGAQHAAEALVLAVVAVVAVVLERDRAHLLRERVDLSTLSALAGMP